MRAFGPLIGLLFLASNAGAVTVGLATAHVRKNWDVKSMVINGSTRPLTIRADSTITEGPHDYRTATVNTMTLMPGEAKLITGLIHQYQGTGHWHTNITMNPAGQSGEVDHHSWGIQYFSYMVDDQGRMKQLLGPVPHEETPTVADLTIANDQRVGSTFGVVGYEGARNYKAVVLFMNGPLTNNFDAKATVSELPGASDCGDCEVDYERVTGVAPFDVVGLKLDNPTVNWAHHYTPSVGMQRTSGVNWFTLYVNDEGEVYGVQDKFAYTGGMLGGSNDSLPAVSSSTLSPGVPTNQAAPVLGTNQPTFAWDLPAVLPSGVSFSNINFYSLELSTVSNFSPLASTHTVVNNAGASTSFPLPVALAANTTYFWRVSYNGILPGVPQLNPNGGTNRWFSNDSQTRKFTTP